MKLQEITISEAIITRFHEKLLDSLELDVAVAGAGPSGLIAASCLAAKGHKVALFERKLSIGGGMWGGGMMFNEIVVCEDALSILDSFGIRYRKFRDGYFTADSIESVTALGYGCVKSGVRVFNLMSIEDVILKHGRVGGLVVNWSPVEMAGLHIDPLSLNSKWVIDATGHPSEVIKIIERKNPGKINTTTGNFIGEKSMWAEKAEIDTLKNTREVFPGIYVCGMSANATFGSFRMGPIFGGMLLSGKKAAEEIHTRLIAVPEK